MILTSFRCFINAIVPTTDKDTLLRSQYFVLDVMGDRSDSISYGDNGEINVRRTGFNNNYRIEYVPEIFDPAPHTADITYINVPGGPCVKNKQMSYMKHLLNSDTKYKVYNRMFSETKFIDYPGIMIMFDEHNIINYGSLIAGYMAHEFGVNVDFIDETLRPNIFGNKSGKYVGDVQNARMNIRACKNYKIIKDMKLMIDEHSRENTIANFMSQLSSYKTEELIGIYNMIFPDKPLPRGVYTRDDMFTILTGAMCDGIDFKSGYGYDDINENINTYERELSDWERLEEDFRYELLQDASAGY